MKIPNNTQNNAVAVIVYVAKQSTFFTFVWYTLALKKYLANWFIFILCWLAIIDNCLILQRQFLAKENRFSFRWNFINLRGLSVKQAGVFVKHIRRNALNHLNANPANGETDQTIRW